MVPIYFLIGTILVVFLDVALSRRKAAGAKAGHGELPGFIVLPDRFYAPNHTWSRIAEGGSVEVGLDDFAARLLGRIDNIEVPRPGTKVEKGRTLIAIRREGHIAKISSPIEGVVNETNVALTARPALISEKPGMTWFVRIRPENLKGDLGDLRFGNEAVAWTRNEAGRLAGFLKSKGAAPAPGVVERFDAGVFESFAREFLR